MSADVKARLLAAKLKVESVLRPSQLLKFGSECDEEDELILLELEQNTCDALQSGMPLTIRGLENDTAVLCTDKETYDLKECKTSNSLILMENLESSKDALEQYNLDQTENLEVVERKAICLKSSYLELKRKIPDITRLREYVNQSPYKGPEHEENYSNVKLYSLVDFLDIIPASEGEIISNLKDLGACCIDGKYRTLDFEYVIDCLCIILNVVDSESWSCLDLNLDDLVEKVNDSGELVPVNIIEHLVSVYGEINKPKCSFTERKLSRFFAEMLLQTADSFDLNDFMKVWQDTMPPGIQAKEDDLDGMALIDKTSKPQVVKRFSATELPFDAEKRFEILFEAQEKWTMKEISPYLEDLCLQGQKISSILTRHARSSLTSDEKVFSSRKSFK